MVKEGKINVTSENIFPVIKKFLYSDHDIFLRELISNAIDATQKLITLSNLNEYDKELGDLTIQVEVDKDNKTIKITDKGIGMTIDEVNKYINQIALSSAEDFIKKYEKNENIIGHFGLGFYSAFMVSSKVEINSKSYKKGTRSVHWECNGDPNYIIQPGNKKDRGTEIILHIDEENQQFLDKYTIENLLIKYNKFSSVPIQFGMKTITKNEQDENGENITEEVPNIINNIKPLWKKQPSDITEQEYYDFYHEIYPDTFDDPLFYIHLNIDYPFNLTGILYFPKVKYNNELQKNKIQLYSNQIFITDQVDNIVPDFLMLLHGVIDSPDIPLNVSRSYLQNDSNVRKISSYITRKVGDKLTEIYKNNFDEFKEKWDNIKTFIEYGIISNDKFWDKVNQIYLLKNINNEYFTINEYINKVKENQTNKDNKVVLLYTNNINEHYSYIKEIQEHNYDILLFDNPLDVHLIGKLEQKIDNIKIIRIDSDIVDNLIEKETEDIENEFSDEQIESLKTYIDNIIKESNDKHFFNVILKNIKSKYPFIITQDEFFRRYKEMEMLNNQYFKNNIDTENYNLIVNLNNDIIKNLINSEDDDYKNKTINHLFDLSKLSKKILNGEKLTSFIDRSLDLL